MDKKNIPMKRGVGIMLFLSILLSLAFGFPTSSAGSDKDMAKFQDVSAKHPNVKAIQYLQTNKVVVGYEDGTFKPEQNINRAEFLKIVMETSDFQPAGKNCFSDVTNEWFAQYVCAAAQAGLIDGYDDGTFKPDKSINFAEASKIIANTLELEDAPPAQSGDWFKPYVLSLESVEAIPEDIAAFDENITRGQMSEMIWRIDADRTYKLSKTYDGISKNSQLPNNLRSFKSCKELHDYFEDNSNAPYYMPETSSEIPEGATAIAPSMAEKGGGGGGEAAKDYSSTNLQVSGVDEADIVKNDGQYIYTLKDNTVRILKAYPPAEMKELSIVKFADENFWPREIYVDGDQMVVVGSTYYNDYFNQYTESKIKPQFYYQGGSAKAYIYNIKDRENAKLIRDTALEGDYSSSRKVGDVLYMVVSQDNYIYPWVNSKTWQEEDLVPLFVDDGKFDKMAKCEDVLYMPRAIDETNYLIVAAIPLNPANEIKRQVVIGSSNDIYASPENLFVAQKKYNWWGWYDETGEQEETYVHKFSLNKGDINYEAMGTVPGTSLNQFSMDEYKGNFRITTTLGDVWNEEKKSTNNLYILDSDLKKIGKVEGMAPGERIYSTRFVGDRAYIVTFKKTDPLFVLDVKNPQKPVVLGKLKIPGFSDYLHPYDENHIIGVGKDTIDPSDEETESFWANVDFAWYQGMKIALFDVTDVENPIELHKEIIGDRGTTSELLYNHKALLYSKTKGLDGGALMAFPITVTKIPDEIKNSPDTSGDTYGDPIFQGAYVYDVSPKNGFKLRGKITQLKDEDIGEDPGNFWYNSKNIERIIYIGDYFYTISQAMVKASGMTSPLNDVKELELENLENDKNAMG